MTHVDLGLQGIYYLMNLLFPFIYFLFSLDLFFFHLSLSYVMIWKKWNFPFESKDQKAGFGIVRISTDCPDFVRLSGFSKIFRDNFFQQKILPYFLRGKKRKFIISLLNPFGRLKINTHFVFCFSISLEFNVIIRQLNFQFQNQYSKHETVITTPVYHLLIESTGKTSKRLKL